MTSYFKIIVKFKKGNEFIDHSYILATKDRDYTTFQDFCKQKDEIVCFGFEDIENEKDLNKDDVFSSLADVIKDCELKIEREINPQYTKISIKFERDGQTSFSEYYMIHSTGIWDAIDDACIKMKEIKEYIFDPIDDPDEERLEIFRIWANVDDVIDDIRGSIGSIKGYPYFLFTIYRDGMPEFKILLSDEQYEILNFATILSGAFNAKIKMIEHDEKRYCSQKIYTSKDSALVSVRKYYKNLSIQYKKQ